MKTLPHQEPLTRPSFLSTRASLRGTFLILTIVAHLFLVAGAMRLTGQTSVPQDGAAFAAAEKQGQTRIDPGASPDVLLPVENLGGDVDVGLAAQAGQGARIDAFHTAPKRVQWVDQSSAAVAAPAKVKVLIVDGYSNHDWPRTTRLTRSILERSGVCDVGVATVPVDRTDPAYERWLPTFKDFDVVVQTCNDLGGKGPPWPGAAQAAFEEFVRGGGGVFVLHSGNNAFADWPAYNRIIGLGWRPKDFGPALRVRDDESVERIPPGVGAGTSHGARTDRLIHRLGDDPVHAGMPRAWKTPLIEVYTYARGPAEDLTVLSWAEEPHTHERWPIEWTVQYGAGRVYNSTFGHVWHDEVDPVDMRCAGFQTILVRAMQWLARQPVTFPVPADFPTADATSLRPLDDPPGR